MSRSPFARRAACAAAALVAVLIVAPSASAAPLAGPTNLRVAAITPHSVTLAWNAATNPGSFTYVIQASFGYRLGVKPPETSFTWTRDMLPGRTYSFVMWAGNAKGQESAKSNKLTVTLPVDRTPPAAPVVVGDRHDLVQRRALVARGRGRRPHLLHVPRLRERYPGLAGQPGVDRRAGRDGAAARSRDDVLVHGRRRRPVAQRVCAEHGRVGGHAGDQRHDRPEAPGNLDRVGLRVRNLALLGEVGRRRRPAVRHSLRGLRERRFRMAARPTPTAGSPTARRARTRSPSRRSTAPATVL